MKNVIGIIDLVGENNAALPLTAERTLASVPFGGRYRLIDFILSSMVNSGVDNVSILLQEKYRELFDHIGQGKEWSLDRKRNGLFMLPPPYSGGADSKITGNLHYFQAHKEHFLRSTQEYVLIAPAFVVCNVDFGKMLQRHVQQHADVSVMVFETDNDKGADVYSLDLDAADVVRSIRARTEAASGKQFVSTKIVLLKKSLFLELIESALAQGGSDFFEDAIMKHADQLKIAGYKEEGVFGIVNTLRSYYHHSMELLRFQTRKQLLCGGVGPIMTKVKDESPTRYAGEGHISNVIIAGGCTIEGTIENSIIFRGVHVEKGAVVRNSILLPDCHVAENASLEHVIFDKHVSIGSGKKIYGDKIASFIAEKDRFL